MITAHALEVRAGARLLMDGRLASGSAAGDKIGLVGRNGAGKTTLTKILAGEGAARPAARSTRTGEVGYLPQDPRTGDLDVLARDRILSARGLDDVVRRLREAEVEMASDGRHGPRPGDAPLRQAEAELHAGGGYAAEAEAAQIAPASACPTGSSASRCAPCPAVSAAGSSWPGSCSRGAETLLLDEPTNHLDADSIVWLRDFLVAHKGGLVVISHDVGLLEATRQPGLPPRRQPGRDRHLQRRLEGLPAAARDRRAAPQARAGRTPRRRPRR